MNQLISENDTTYEYDTNGNLIRIIGKDKAAIYVYNSENKLIKATVQSGSNVIVEEYTYDFAGNRTSKSTSCNGQVEYVKYLNDNSSLTNVLVEINADGDEVCYYTIGADLISQEVDGKVSTYLYDGHGTVRALADEDGNVTDTYSYDAFGNMLKSTGTTANNYRYCGEQFDSTTGLYYLRARYMNTSTGRFISQDSYAGSTADPVSLHKYLYANSNPVMYSDPSGYYSLGEMAVSMAVSGSIGGITSAGLNLLTQLTTKAPNEKINWSEVIMDGVVGFLFGAAFGMFGYVGMWYQSAAIMYALSGACAVGFISSATVGCVYFSQGNYIMGGTYFFLAFLSASGALKTQKQAISFQQQRQAAAATAQTTTNPSTQNTNTANTNSNNNAKVDVRKFSEYIFKENATHGKNTVFENLGYSKNESAQLVKIYEQQAMQKYSNGNYTLGVKDSYGQRINIEIELYGIGESSGEVSYIKSGWMINSDGTISLNTPFSGFTR